jgi:hypothetical protein
MLAILTDNARRLLATFIEEKGKVSPLPRGNHPIDLQRETKLWLACVEYKLLRSNGINAKKLVCKKYALSDKNLEKWLAIFKKRGQLPTKK